jgi:hypothetical protein
MREEGVDVLFLGLSSDLEYLSGVERGIPFFGQSSYPHGWVAGAFFRPDAEPVFVLPRMVVVFDLPVRPDGEIVVVDETDDGRAVFERVAKGLGKAGVGRDRRSGVGRDDDRARPHLRARAAADRRGTRQPPPPCQDGRRARRHGPGVPTVEAAMAAVTPLVQPA